MTQFTPLSNEGKLEGFVFLKPYRIIQSTLSECWLTLIIKIRSVTREALELGRGGGNAPFYSQFVPRTTARVIFCKCILGACSLHLIQKRSVELKWDCPWGIW